MSRTAADRLAFVKNLQTETPIHPALRAVAEDQPSAAVDAGSSVSFVGDLPLAMRSDVLNSTLLAQLAANKKYDRQKQTTEWYDYYKTVLETVGWVVEGFSLGAQSDASSYGSVDKLLLKLAATYLTNAEFGLFETMIESLKDDKNGDQVKLFDSQAKSFNEANFQLGVASNAQGNAQFKIGVYTYSASENIDRVLFYTFGHQSVSFYAGSQTMVLDEDVYSQVREAVLEKLGSNAVNLVDDITI
ncbi:hypothetical protein C8Q70DRAFT_1056690 [Cubamyces menziesii]|uniref:Uncharacterized protein n=1 Tax=Trametes cubensis TaxID=1111947 RepID=A0AAD7TWD0_9APHY|nr:hypothetical protein C8Q70DRAFT_1056690 [Cubamyces menziesii]KAJ8482406.1 hypothetical protein ONZ51_g5373 [Trametes cubensis]